MSEQLVSIQTLQETMAQGAAPWVTDLGLQVVEVRTHEVELRLPITPRLVHGGGVLCGQAILAAADMAMVLAISVELGGFKPMTTVQLQTSFLRPIVPTIAPTSASARVVARVLRKGRNLVFGEIEFFDAENRLAAHATTTYALI